MSAHFTSVILDNGLLPIAAPIRKRLGLHPGDQVRIRIELLNRDERQTSQARYENLLAEKDDRVLTPREQAELIALANGEFDTAIARAKKIVKKNQPELFNKKGNLNRQKALVMLRAQKEKKSLPTTNGRQSKKRQPDARQVV
jgi:hypothetical protein